MSETDITMRLSRRLCSVTLSENGGITLRGAGTCLYAASLTQAKMRLVLLDGSDQGTLRRLLAKMEDAVRLVRRED